MKISKTLGVGTHVHISKKVINDYLDGKNSLIKEFLKILENIKQDTKTPKWIKNINTNFVAIPNTDTFNLKIMSYSYQNEDKVKLNITIHNNDIHLMIFELKSDKTFKIIIENNNMRLVYDHEDVNKNENIFIRFLTFIKETFSL